MIDWGVALSVCMGIAMYNVASGIIMGVLMGLGNRVTKR